MDVCIERSVAVFLHNYYSPELVSQSNIGYTHKGRNLFVQELRRNERIVRPNRGGGRNEDLTG